MPLSHDVDTLILGAGAAGMMCAAEAARGGGRVLVIDHAKSPGEKIRISGGGRCNFTNMHCEPGAFLGQNPHFAKSALSRYTQWDFIDLVSRHGIAWHEKTLGQLFCDGSARQIIAMLRAEMGAAELWLQTALTGVTHADGRFAAELEREGQRHTVRAANLVLATGGKSIPKMGATGLAYRLAEQFGLGLTETRPALVPLTFGPQELDWIAPLAGVATPARASAGQGQFDEALLFTHRGLSGPAILQISSYWREGQAIRLDLDPDGAVLTALKQTRASAGRRTVPTVLGQVLPTRLAQHLAQRAGLAEARVADCADSVLAALEAQIREWELKPTGSEGYRTAEVTLGGIDTAGLDSRTMGARALPGLYAIGEAVDVTGWLGGYNFQWAWSSGWAAGQAIAASGRAG